MQAKIPVQIKPHMGREGVSALYGTRDKLSCTVGNPQVKWHDIGDSQFMCGQSYHFKIHYHVFLNQPAFVNSLKCTPEKGECQQYCIGSRSKIKMDRAFWNRWTLDLHFGPGNAGLLNKISDQKHTTFAAIFICFWAGFSGNLQPRFQWFQNADEQTDTTNHLMISIWWIYSNCWIPN